MIPFEVKYHPQISNKNITGICVETITDTQNDKLKQVDVDLKTLQLVLNDISKNNLSIPVTVKIDTSSLLDNNFILSLSNYKLISKIFLEFHIPSDISKALLYKLNINIEFIKKVGFATSLVWSEIDQSKLILMSNINFDQIKFSSTLVNGINESYHQYKYLSYLNDVAISYGIKYVIFDGVENEKQQELVQLINANGSMQGPIYGNGYNALRLLSNYTISQKQTIKNSKINTDWLVYNYITSNYNSTWLNEITKITTDYKNCSNQKELISNLVENYSRDNDEQNPFILNVMKNSDNMFVLRNTDGIVLFENKNHENFFGRSLIGLPVNDVISIVPDYYLCIEDDKHLLNSTELFSVKKEVVDGGLYFTIRQKVTIENNVYIAVTVYEENKGLFISKDPLTGCMSRESIKNIADNFFYDNKIIAFIDLNGFKKVNDTLGHEVGDSVLIEFCEIVQKNIRIETKDDIIVRYGGDEFIIFFNSSNLKEINTKLNEINNIISNHFNKKNIYLSFSHGLAINYNNDVETTIKKSDKSMYLAKTSLKNNTAPFDF